MKQQVFYIHGGSSYSKYEDYLDDLVNQPLRSASDQLPLEKWPIKLRDQLGPEYQVFMPEFPNKHNSKYEEWKIWFEKHFKYIQDEVILVCWSQGGMFITKYLAENEIPFTVKALFLLASPFDFCVTEGMKEDGGDFYANTNDIPRMVQKVKHITLMHSQDDFVVSYEHALKYKEVLPQAELVTFTDKNHFLVEELPELVERIKSLM